MTSRPTILIAGDRNISGILAQRLPPRVCKFVSAGTFVTALSEAADASAVVVDGQMPGYQELCSHLKSDPMTEEIPLIFLVHAGEESSGLPVDCEVPAGDPAALERELRKRCPALALSSGPVPDMDIPAPEPLEDDAPAIDEIFDDKESTAMFRRPATAPGTAPEWPPPPPRLKAKQDMVDFAKEYAGYFNSLIEVLEDPDRLSDAERQRLDEVCKLTLDDAESLISAVQASMNEALRAKDLERMRVLSTAKNRLYEKRARVRTLAAGPSPAAIVDQPGRGGRPRTQPPVDDDGWDMNGEALLDERRSGNTPPVELASDGIPVAVPDIAPAAAKSALTLAAEAKELERRKTARMARKSGKLPQVKPPPLRHAGHARHTAPGYGWIWIPVAGLLVLVAAFTIWVSVGKREPDKKAKATGNSPPFMKWVVIEQTPAGVVARPVAEDRDKDRITYSIVWYNNGKPVEGERTARLKPTNYAPGDAIHVEVTPSDLVDEGRAMRSRELTIKEDFGKRRPSP